MMKNEQKQLYKLVRNFELPFIAIKNSNTKGYQVVNHNIDAVMAINWPDGSPCLFIEMFMLDIRARYSVNSIDGGSLKVIASSLSSLIRYCWKEKKQFVDLVDQDIKILIHQLQTETLPGNATALKRQGNTINRTVSYWIMFLEWLQDNLYFEKKIIGPVNENPQIPLQKKVLLNAKSGKKETRFIYRYQPVAATPENVGPIGRELRKKLWEAVANLSKIDDLDDRYKHSFESEKELYLEVEYLRKRRELLLELLEATGARPGELATIAMSKNQNCTLDGRLILNTLKRKNLPERSVPIDKGLAIRVELFIHKYRQRLLDETAIKGIHCKPNDFLFLSRKGMPIHASTFEREFSRLLKTAGISDQQTCMSMFRHRFITNMVRIHLSAFMDQNPNTSRHLMTQDDYRTILHRVATFTGHGSPDSLLHYIDMAWDEMGLFDYVEPAYELIRQLDNGLNELSMFSSTLISRSRIRPDFILNQVESLLLKIRNDTYKAINKMNKKNINSY